ncbi:MAG: FAD-binding oxidoreductase [Solirubrobacteraceae bacterium]
MPLTPESFEQAAGTLAALTAEKRSVHLRGGGTKLGWGHPPVPDCVEIRSRGLDRTLEHNAGDLTAIFQAGVPLARAQQELAERGQMLALDPPLGAGADDEDEDEATIGGVFATGDSGPLRHRFGSPRELILGITVALSDGTLARAGGKVIKNVAGYDLAKLFTGSFGTLGMILSISVRLHPLPAVSATALGAAQNPDQLSAAARVLAAAPLEFDALDIAWRSGRGGLLARCAGPEAVRRCRRAVAMMGQAGLEQLDVVEDDEPLWLRQRAGQRSTRRALVRIAARPSALAGLLRATDAVGGTLVGRAAIGTVYVELVPDAVVALLSQLPPGAQAVILDAPLSVRTSQDPWGGQSTGTLELMRRVKQRFDPAGVCNPGVFVGGI